MAWWRRRRWWVLGAALAVVVVGAGGVVAMVAVAPASPEDVVGEYLDVLRSGDAEAAREYAGVVVEFDEVSDDLLVAEAMSQDWSVTRVVRRHHEADDPATVDVTIAGPDGTAREGRFELLHGDDGWTIRNPLVKIDLSSTPLSFAEFNDVTSDAESVWLFPGAYRVYDSVSDLVTLSAPTFVAVPHAAYPEHRLREEPYLPEIGFTDRLDAALHEQLAAWIDDCAARPEPFPDDCPFAAGRPDNSEIWVAGRTYRADADAVVAWEVVSQPAVRLARGQGYLYLRSVRPVELRITGTANLTFEERREDFSSACPVLLDDVRVTMPQPGEFAFHPGPDTGRNACANVYLDW